MLKLKYLIVFFLTTYTALGQEKSQYSLRDCIDYALQNHTKIKGVQLDEQLQLEKNKEIVGIARPQVSATGQFQYLFVIPKQRIDAGAFDFSSSLSFFKIDTPAFIAYQNQPKEKYSEAQFGLPLNLSAGVQASQILFESGVFVALKARKSLEELSVLNIKRTEEEVKIAVAKAYYNCVIAEKRIKLLDENIQLLNSLEEMTLKLFNEGFAERIDADRLTVQKNNLITERDKINNLVQLSYGLLKFQIGMPFNQVIRLTDDLNADEIRSNIELDRVAAAVSGSFATQTIAFKELFTLPYFPTGAFVLNASMPLYDGGTRKAKMNQARLNMLKNENDMLALQQAVDLESSNARTQLRNSIMSLDSQEKNIELAQKVYNIAQKKYKEGVGTNIEILQAETALKEAKTNYFNSLYEAIIAKLDFQKSLGIFK
jgi:outer membrane protein TolC